VLHVTGADALALEATLRSLASEAGVRAEPIDTGLEDVFIHMMRGSSDNYGAQP
jgi:ABC-2 type transport system ATP-binding protein